MSTLSQTEFYVPEDGKIILPEKFRGSKIFVQKIDSIHVKREGKSPVQELLDFCVKDSRTLTDEDIDDYRYEYLSEKYR